MNGEVNGIMDKPMDTAVSNSPESLLVEKISENHDNTTDTIENSNNEVTIHTENQNSMNSKLSGGNEEESNDDNSNASEPDTQMSTNMSENDNSNNTYLDNHCSNSKDSDGESMTSSQAKSETTEHPNSIDDQSKDGQSVEKNICTNENTENETDSEDDSSEEDFNVRPGREDAVCINSDSEIEEIYDFSEYNPKPSKNIDAIILGNESSQSQNGNSHGSPSPEVHEIESDTGESTVSKNNSNLSENKVQLRRSSRAIKRKRYNDDVVNGCDESDIEEVSVESNFNHKGKTIVISDTRTLVDMAAKQMNNHSSNSTPKKEHTVVIIDTNSSTSDKSSAVPKPLPTSTNVSAENLYQSIVARGTTVTPVKSNASTQISSQTTQPPILPSLTDDMFVVEAPSFIVPYVYEKPSLKPFREFVDILGKELDEQKAKEEKENQEKLKKEKMERFVKEKENGDEDEVCDDNVSADSVEATKQDTKFASEGGDRSKDRSASADPSEDSEEKIKKKKEKRRRRKNDDDDASWDGESSEDSDDELLSDEDKTIIIKEKVDSIDEIKDVTELTADKVCINRSDNYFDCSLGKFFINIGLGLVQEFVQSDLLKQQNRKLYREKKTGQNTKATETSIASLMKNIEFSKENNAPYSFPQNKCEFCSFKSESSLVMKHHLETPHMKNNVYKCNFCSFEIRSPHDILFHMEAEHNVRGRLERAPAYHQCANCPFEDNGKGKLARHLIPCAKKFKPEMNLAPPLEWEPPAKIPKITKARHSLMGSYQPQFNRNQIGTPIARPPGLNVSSMMAGVSSYRPRGRSPMAVPPRSAPVHGTPIIRGGVMIRHNSPGLMSANYPMANNLKQKSGHQPSISITPLPRAPQPQALPQPVHNAKSTFVICEICDGYIKDLEQLRNHMQWIHKVKIHPKMIYNRPPLNCQKCQFRFFTDQGLERHLLGSHGLVTSSMQEAANKGKDAGRCPVCGRVYQWKLLNHVARDHNLTLKPAHLSYKCTVCTATFGMYKQFENHVYSAHSVVAKRVMDKSKSTAPAPKVNSESLLKPLKINDEITIIPQPVKAASAKDD